MGHGTMAGSWSCVSMTQCPTLFDSFPHLEPTEAATWREAPRQDCAPFMGQVCDPFFRPVHLSSARQLRLALVSCLLSVVSVIVCLNVCLYMVGRQLYKYVSSFSHLIAFASSSRLALPDSGKHSTWPNTWISLRNWLLELDKSINKASKNVAIKFFNNFATHSKFLCTKLCGPFSIKRN